MAVKTTPLSVRVPVEDAAFIAQLEIGEALTPSDKIRALLKQAREEQEQQKDPGYCVGWVRRILEPFVEGIQRAELACDQHSDLLAAFADWQAKMLSYLASLDETDLDLEAVEEELATRIFRLIATVFRLSITREAPCYDPHLLGSKLEGLAELFQLLQTRLAKEVAHETKDS
jgi:hypothetical protein